MVYIIFAAEEKEGWMVTHFKRVGTAVIHIICIHIPLDRSSPVAPHICKRAGRLSFYVLRKEKRTRYE